MLESASIDRCGKFKQAIYITIPSILSTAVFLLIMGIGGLVSSNFEAVYGLQNVYIQNDTEVINTLIYRQGIQAGEYSLSTTFGLVQGIISFALVLLANRFSKFIAGISLW